MSLLTERRKLREFTWEEKDQYHDACRRAARIAGIFNFLIEEEALNPSNLQGKAVDLGTGGGGGALAVRLFGAKDVMGVDDCLGLGGGLGVIEAIPSRTVFNIPGVRFQLERVQDFINNQSPETFDLITAFRLPPFRFPAPPELCQMVHTLLKPGGQVVISEGDMVNPWEEDRLLRKSGKMPIEITFKGKDKPWWDVEKFDGRLFFLPVLRPANIQEIKRNRRIVIWQKMGGNYTDKEVFIGAKL